MAAIENFPPPTDLTSVRSWFGLINQVSWAYSISPIMEPFRDLIKPHNNFYWDEVLQELFKLSKAEILSKVEGVRTFDPTRRGLVYKQIGVNTELGIYYSKNTVTVRMPTMWFVVPMVGN